MKIIKHLSERNFLFLAIIWTVLITVASLVSSNNIPKVSILGNDKIVHFLFYFVFVVLWSFATVKSYLNIKYDLLIVAFAILYGIIIEVLQSVLTKTREADLYDMFANSLGAIVGFIGFFVVKNKIFNKYF
ncbi:VanZ family protein [Flavobacterium lacisediminis]|uniref:VanZ family protein n=1 Tax=Flavobacterium lacisediminis TaxID=2989705 RepID=A0ABT3EG88_9FLAO|nr:VanZ family protein [Flavobacterium lacisediminis]